MRPLRWLLAALATAFALAVAAVAFVATAGVDVRAPWLRERLAAALGDSLGRPVAFDGPVVLRLSWRPELRASGLHVGNAPGFDDARVLTLAEARLSVELWPLLHERRLQVREAAGEDAVLWLQVLPDGRASWSSAGGARGGSGGHGGIGDDPGRGAAEREAARPLTIDVERLSLRRVSVHFRAPDGRVRELAVDALDLQGAGGQPLRASLRGTVERRFPYELTVSAGPLRAFPTGGSQPNDSPPGQGPSAAPAWPLEATLAFLGSSARLDGGLSHGPSGLAGRFEFGLGTADAEELERLLEVSLPKVGAAALAGTLELTRERLSMQSLVGTLGTTTLTGELAVELGGERPMLRGRLELPALDLRPFLGEDAASDAPTRTLAQWYRETASARFDLSVLDAVDADLEIGVGRWLSLPGEVADARLQLKLAGGRLSAPLRARVAGVNLVGELLADGSATPPRVELTAGARDSALGGLAELLFGLRGVNGALGGFALRATAQGGRVGDLAKTLDVRLVIANGGLTYGNLPDSAGGAVPGTAADPAAVPSEDGPAPSPVAFGLESLVLQLPAGGRLTMSAKGSLLEQPLDATLEGAPLDALMRGGTQVDVAASSRSVRARLRGTLERPDAAAGAELSISLSAARVADLAPWLRLGEGQSMPVAIEGRARWRANAWAVSAAELRIGRNRLAAELSRTASPAAGAKGAAARPLTTLSLVADQLDVAEIDAMLPRSSVRGGPARPVLELPILPAGVDLSDTDLRVDVKRITGSVLEPTGLHFDAQVRDGRLLASPFSATLLGTRFEGAVALDLRGATPHAELWLGADDADVGAVLRRLQLADDVDATVGKLVLHGVTSGSRLGELLGQTRLQADLGAGRLGVRERNTGARAEVVLERGSLRAEPGGPLAAEISGTLDGEPVTMQLGSGPLVDLARTDRRVPFELRARFAQAALRIVGSLARPVADRDLEFAMNLEGARIDTLSRLARVSLPPWGPYSLIGRLQLSRSGYEVSNMRLRVGSSVLRGDGSLDTTASPPRAEVRLSAPQLQLDDFALREWWPFERASPEPSVHPAATATDVDRLRRQAAQASGEVERLLSPQALRRQDATLVVQVDQVLAGAEPLGNGWLVARVEAGRADIGPVQVDVPGGRASLWLGYAPSGRGVDAYVRLQADRFDYGILARRIQPGTDLAGTLSVDLDLRASGAPSLARAMEHGNGSLDFRVWPENLRADVFDLWAANLFVTLAQRFDPSAAPTVNCGIGRFTLTDGVLASRELLLDTTRVRVRGEGTADVRDERLALRFVPKPKRAQFFSLATPVVVGGSFTQPAIGVAPGDVLATAGRLATSLLWVPLQTLFGRVVPADGSDVCHADRADTASPRAPDPR
jgi:hypothetical protein